MLPRTLVALALREHFCLKTITYFTDNVNTISQMGKMKLNEQICLMLTLKLLLQVYF